LSVVDNDSDVLRTTTMRGARTCDMEGPVVRALRPRIGTRSSSIGVFSISRIRVTPYNVVERKNSNHTSGIRVL
jgi:hypothetical protein